MRIILNISIAGMLAAGVYGFADFARDLHNGDLIKYDDGKEVAKKDAPASANKKMAVNDKTPKAIMKNAAAIIANGAKISDDKKENTEIDMSKMKLRYFSRGEPVVVDEEVSDAVDTHALPDSAAAVVSDENETAEKEKIPAQSDPK